MKLPSHQDEWLCSQQIVSRFSSRPSRCADKLFPERRDIFLRFQEIKREFKQTTLIQITPTDIPEVLLIEPRVFGDERGFFMETYSARAGAELGIERPFVQDNHSLSSQGTLRGLHYQLAQPQAKLCRVVRGAVWDVAVDIRRGSPTFGRHVAALLSAENKRQIYVPRGFAHGFLVLSDEAEFLYKCDDFYAPGDEHGVRWDDPALDIRWPLQEHEITTPLLSDKDREAPALGEIEEAHLPVFSVT